ncbi:MAG: DUF3572 domain-containing protein [Ahrensia sp.]|nr:DUF3572 domain-containing protein [Ahrensia sp.]
MTQEEAERIAIVALGRLAADDELLMRFSALTGVPRNDFRAAAGEPGFLAGVLDFFAGHEPDLLALANASDISPESIVAAQMALSGNNQQEFI